MSGRTVLRGSALVVEGVIIAVAAYVVGAAIGHFTVDRHIVECMELDCILPPIVGSLGGLVIGGVAGAIVGVRGRGRPLLESARWAIVAGAAGLAAYLYLSR